MSKKIKICELCAVDFTVVKLLMPLIIRLKEKGYEVHVACSDGPNRDAIQKNNIHLENIKIPRKFKPLEILISIFLLYIYFKKEKFDILHVHTPLAAYIGRVAGFMAGIEIIIYTAHGFYFHERMNLIRRKIYQLIEKNLAKITDIIFIQSSEDFEYALREKFCNPEKIFRIGNGVNLLKFNKLNIKKFQKKLNENNVARRITIGTCSRLDKEKGLVELIRVSRKLLHEGLEVNFLFLIATNPDYSDAGLLDLLCKFKKDNPENVDIKFDVDSVELFLAKIDIFALLSHREGLPRSIIEAIAIGLPIVATNIRGSRELIKHGVNGLLVEVKDCFGAYIALKTLVLDNDQRIKFEAANKIIRSIYNEENVLDKQITELEKYMTVRGLIC